MKFSIRHCILPFALFCNLSTLTTTGSAQPGADDWGAYGKVEKETKDAEPQAAIDAWRKFYESRPNLMPRIGINVTVKIGDLYSEKLNDKDKTLEIDEWAIKKYADQPEAVVLVEQKAKTLLAQKKYDEAAKVWEDNWPLLLRGGQISEDWLAMYAATTMRHADDSYTALGQGDKAIAMILKGFDAFPSLLDDKMQGQGGWRNGWMYRSLIPKLLKAGRAEEALRWAKMHFALCGFDKECIARATASLGQVWGDQEEYQKIRIFAQFQGGTADPAAKNPLADVKLPALDAKMLKEQAARTEIAAQKMENFKVSEHINILLAQGDYLGAMGTARRLMKNDPAKPDGALQICRVFKAADLSTRRANEYLLFLEGKAENPMPAFLKEYGDKPAVTASTPTVTPAAP